MNLNKSRDSKVIFRNLVDIAIDGIEDADLSNECGVVRDVFLKAQKSGSAAIAGKKDDESSAFQRIEESLSEKLDLAKLDDSQKIKLQDFIVLIFDAYRISSAESTFRKDQISGYVDKAIQSVPTPDRKHMNEDEAFKLLVDHLGQIKISNVFTMHPTFSGTLEYSNLMHSYAEAVSSGDSDKVKEIGAQLMSPEYRTTLVENLTPEEEGMYGREFVRRSFKALPSIYAEFDKSLAKRNENYDPITLPLDIVTESWIQTDKDGNPNITHEITALAVKGKREDARDLFTEILNQFDDTSQKVILGARLQDLTNMEYADIASLREEMSEFFKTNYYEAKEGGNEELAQHALDAHRAIKHYGLSMGSQEYRETANVFSPIIDQVLGQSYTELGDRKGAWLNDLLQDPERLADFKVKLEALCELDSTDQIVKDTYNRIKLAQENPDVFPGQHALAEAETPLQMKEYLLFLKAMGADKQLRITPLFEKPNILVKMDGVVDEMLNDPSIKGYYIDLSLAEFKKAGIDFDLNAQFEEGSSLTVEDKIREYRYGGKEELEALNKVISEKSGGRYRLEDILKLEIMFAHSDNGRRGGTVGARGAISLAHRQAFETGAANGFGVGFYEGGSITDPKRGGMRSRKSQTNIYDQRDGNGHVSTKNTVQGRDLNELLISKNTYALYIVEELVTGIKGTSFWNGESYQKPSGRESVNFRQAASPVGEIVHAAIGSLGHYTSSFFEAKIANTYVIEVLGYPDVAMFTNKGSRPPAREGVEPNIQETRTIPFSQTCIFGRSNISFIGYREFINKAYEDISAEVKDICAKSDPVMKGEAKHDIAKHLEFSQFAKIAESENISDSPGFSGGAADISYDGVKSKAQVTQILYQTSPMTKDITDRVAYSIATSDMNYVEHLAAEVCETKAEMRDFLTRIEGEYVAAAEHVLEAYTGKSQDLKSKSYDQIREAVKDQMVDKDLIDMSDVALSLVNVINESMDNPDKIVSFNTTAKATLHRPQLATEATREIQPGIAA